MLKFIAIASVAILFLACSLNEPEVVTVIVTATSEPNTDTPASTPVPASTHTPFPTSTLVPTYTPMPIPTSTPVPTNTPLPPITLTHDDCIDCPVVMLGVNRNALKKYEELPASKHHTEKVLLVACGRDNHVPGLGEVMGGRRSGTADEVFVDGVADIEFGECLAITATYAGIQKACRPEPWDTSGYGCSIGKGKTIEVFTFRIVGQMTFLTTSQYNDLNVRR